MCTGFEIPAFAELIGGATVAEGAAVGAGALGASEAAMGAGLLSAGGLEAGAATLGEGFLTSGILAGEGSLGAMGALGTGTSFSAMGPGAAFGSGIEGGWPGAEGMFEASSEMGGGPLGAEGLNAEVMNTAEGYNGFTGFGGPATPAGNSTDWMGAMLKYASPVSSVVSGLTGLQRQAEMRRMAKQAMKTGDPWGTSGGRSAADAQLQQLLRDPSSVAAIDPAYKLRIQGAQRANAQYGQDSGRMAIAGADASTDWYNARLAQLGGLAGAGVNPGGATQVGLQGLDSANDLLSSSLASIGFAMPGAGGLTPQQQMRLLAMVKGP